eukprot:2579615-Amphidinium_carterae.1
MMRLLPHVTLWASNLTGNGSHHRHHDCTRSLSPEADLQGCSRCAHYQQCRDSTSPEVSFDNLLC